MNNFKDDSWETKGGIWEAFKYFFKETKINYVVLEFGTAGNLSVLYALLKDHQNFAQQKKDPLRIKQMVRAFFLPEQFQNSAVAQALKTFEIVKNLSPKNISLQK